MLAHGLIRSSFVPPAPIQELRDLTRTRKQLVAEIARHTLRIQKTLEDANLKLTRAVSDILGTRCRAVLRALIAGETDPERLADLTTGRLKATRARNSSRPCARAIRPAEEPSRTQEAIVAVTASLLTAAYFMLRDGVEYVTLVVRTSRSVMSKIRKSGCSGT